MCPVLLTDSPCFCTAFAVTLPTLQVREQVAVDLFGLSGLVAGTPRMFSKLFLTEQGASNKNTAKMDMASVLVLLIADNLVILEFVFKNRITTIAPSMFKMEFRYGNFTNVLIYKCVALFLLNVVSVFICPPVQRRNQQGCKNQCTGQSANNYRCEGSLHVRANS